MAQLNTAVDFRARLRFPRLTRGLLGRTSLWGLTLATSPAGVFVLHSNQQLEPVKTNNGFNRSYYLLSDTDQLIEILTHSKTKKLVDWSNSWTLSTS
jgi:hypothetical protein